MAGTDAIRIGLLFSVTGSYRTIGKAMLNGARLALEEINDSHGFPFRLEAVFRDPGGSNQRYADAAQAMLADERLMHVVGCYTSSSRKEVLPFFEKYDGLLWYPSHYEGFESSEHVVYTGAAPNQHILPLAEWLLRHCGNRAFFIGSNYIWAWENNKIMREAVQVAGGDVLAERYLPVGETDFSGLIEQILAVRPRFVFNTLIGESAYAFFRQFRDAALDAGIDQPRDLPIASCSLAEPELVEIGRQAAAGHISSSVYFETVRSAANRTFLELTGSVSRRPDRPAPMSKRPTSPCICWLRRSRPPAPRIWSPCAPRSPISLWTHPRGGCWSTRTIATAT